jgi:GT2 family glycosyltransferase
VRPWGVLDRYRAPIPLPAPRVSVIVPCHNHAGTTAAGLAALRRARTKVPFEIIAVDDASSDATPEVLEAAGRQAQRMKVFTLAANAGFSQANNHAAFVAEGEYLVFLNNDTEVRDGWLDALVELLDERRDAGAAGAKLVYPDGRLQEAGGIVFSDGSGWNYGRFDPPDHPDYNRVREVDYASAAALIVRKAAFRRLGGFDVRYSPAYYEDTDLCFGIRELGLKVLYCPFAEVVHHGGVTASTDEQTGAKRFQPINQAKFADKWAARLVEQPVPTSDRRAVRSAADRRARAFVHDVGRLIAAARGRLAERSLASIAAPE